MQTMLKTANTTPCGDRLRLVVGFNGPHLTVLCFDENTGTIARLDVDDGMVRICGQYPGREGNAIFEHYPDRRDLAHVGTTSVGLIVDNEPVSDALADAANFLRRWFSGQPPAPRSNDPLNGRVLAVAILDALRQAPPPAAAAARRLHHYARNFIAGYNNERPRGFTAGKRPYGQFRDNRSSWLF